MSTYKNLAQVADALYTTRNERLVLQKQVDELQTKETELKEILITKLSKDDATGISGQLCRVTIAVKAVPQVQGPEGWEKFYAYIKKTGSFELLQKRLNDAAVKERWENKDEVPGVSQFINKTVSIHKV